jgi:hypothetical protein
MRTSITFSDGSTHTSKIGASYWYDAAAVNGDMLPHRVAQLEAKILEIRDAHNSRIIGSNHVLEALLQDGLYMRTWPGYTP